jgi:hypothetical protein
MPRHLSGHTAYQEAIEPREPFRAHHNQIRTMAIRSAEDLFSGSPIRKDVIDGEPLLRKPPPHPLKHEQSASFACTHRPLDGLRQIDPSHSADVSQHTVRALLDMQ